jgi:hypothetical protein
MPIDAIGKDSENVVSDENLNAWRNNGNKHKDEEI